MVIQSSTIGMQSTNYYSKRQEQSVSYTGWGTTINQVSGQTATTSPSATDSVQNKNQETNLSLTQDGVLAQRILLGSKQQFSYQGEDQIEFDALNNLMMLLFDDENPPQKVSAETLFKRLLAKYKSDLEFALYGGASARPTQAWGNEVTLMDLYQENESSTFYSSGTVITKDGKEITFDISATMSRSFLSYTNASIDYVSASLVDPLIINLSGDTAQVSDQKFLFDLDADGEQDNISLLAEHCAFLAIDKNKDGKINDGNELFGAKTGDGFAELAVFDLDKNGWIDEKDEIFNHLRIWKKSEDGSDELVALGIAGIGAIYLGNKNTRFTLTDESHNQVNGQIKKTGIYLKEDGTAGTIQHVDMAVETA